MRYYYGQLTKPLQGVYDTLLSGFRVYAPSIRIPDVEQGQLAEIYLRLKLDEPLLFYVTGYRCRWMPGAGPSGAAAGSICLTRARSAPPAGDRGTALAPDPAPAGQAGA